VTPRFAAALAGCLLLLAACTSSGGTNAAGYISGDGQVVQYAAADRADPIELAGETLTGEPIDLADLQGEVVVVNFWGAWCADCHAEMPELVAAHEELGDRATFLGVNTRDPSRDSALAFERDYGVEYPSVDASSEPQLLLAFEGVYNPRFTPTTLVLDTEGRVAAMIQGRIPSTRTLVQVTEDVIAGKDPGGSDG
jgi:thiol-disulfide isomerase/thioredoxin